MYSGPGLGFPSRAFVGVGVRGHACACVGMPVHVCMCGHACACVHVRARVFLWFLAFEQETQVPC